MTSKSTLTPYLRLIALSVREHHAIHANMGGDDLTRGEQIVSAQVVLGIAYSFADEWSADTARAVLSACGFSDEIVTTLVVDDQPDAWY